jgi:hypothetical protein
VHASVASESPFTITVNGSTPAGTLASYPLQPFSLVVQTNNGSGTRYLKPLAAREFTPALPRVFGSNQTWRGTFAGTDPVPRGGLLYAGFGQFTYAALFGARPFSISSLKSVRAP